MKQLKLLYKRKKSKRELFLACILITTIITGCGNETGSSTSSLNTSEETSKETTIDYNMELTESTVNTEFTKQEQDQSYDEKEATIITLEDINSKVNGSGASVKNSTVTITKAGTYVISGTLNNGQIIVEATKTDKIQIILKNTNINCDTSAALYVKQADKVFLTLADKSKNVLSGGTQYVAIDDNTIDGVIFSKDDFCINGNGALTVEANYKHGIVSKDDLVITNGTINVTAKSQCLSGKDCIRIKNGTFILKSSKKGLKSENTDNIKLGNIYIAGGTFTIDTEDDAVHASGSTIVDGGTFKIETGDDAFHSDVDTVINKGTIEIASCYEGLEGHRVVINGGKITITASDDGINAADPNASTETTDIPSMKKERTNETNKSTDNNTENSSNVDNESKESNNPTDKNQQLSSDFTNMESVQKPPSDLPDMDDEEAKKMFKGGQGHGEGIANDAKAYIKITGGTISVSADGDGIDSNGSLMIAGGTIYVDGSTGNGDSALDYDGNGIITGGTFIALGSSGMAQSFGDASTQYSFMEVLNENQKAGTKIVLEDVDKKEILSYTAKKDYNCIVISSKDLTKDSTYTLTAGTETSEITIDSIAVSNKTGGMREREKVN